MLYESRLFSNPPEKETVMRNHFEPVTEQSVRNTDGILRAWIYVEVTDINGCVNRKRVSLGNDYNTTLETARDTVERVRRSNQQMVSADFRVNL
jgi:hypothetical protein